MIEINGKKLDLEASSIKSEFYKIEKKLRDSWAFLKERHNLELGSKIDMFMFKEFKRKRQISTQDGENFTTVTQYPSGTQISLTALVNFKGTPYEIRYFKSKRPTERPNVFTYDPTSLMIKSDTSYGETDRELILFLYLFTSIVKNTADNLPFVLEETLKSKFYFDDKLVLAQHKNEKRNMIAKATVMLSELEDDKVKIFASTNGINNEQHIDIIRDKIITLIDIQGEPMFDKLQDFIVKFDDSFYGIQELVRAASNKKLFKSYYIKDKGKDATEWWYIKKGSKDTLMISHSGRENSLSIVVDKMASDADALNMLRNKYNNISK